MGSKLPAELFLHFGRQGMADDDNRTTASASREADVRHRLRVRRNEVPREDVFRGKSATSRVSLTLRPPRDGRRRQHDQLNLRTSPRTHSLLTVHAT